MSQIDRQTLVDIYSAIRKSFARRSPHYHAALMRSKSEEQGPRGGIRFICEKCKLSYGRTEIEIDHIDPIIPVTVNMHTLTVEEFYTRCFVQPDKLQVLCKRCHKAKSSLEVKDRVKFRRLAS